MSRASATAVEIVCGRIRTRAPRRRIPRHDVRLEPEIDDPDQRSAFVVTAHVHDRARRHLADEILVLPARNSPRPIDRPVAVDEARLRDDAPERAVRPQVTRQRPRVDAGDRGDPLVAEERGELADVVDDGGGRVGDDERAEPRLERLVVLDQPAVVADKRVGHDDDLAGVRGVGADLLVAGLARVHDEVARRRRLAAPNAIPGKTVPSSRASSAGPRSPTLGSTIELGRGSGGTIVAPSRSQPGPRHENATGPRGSVGARTHSDLPPFRPHGTGSPASQDRPSRTSEA